MGIVLPDPVRVRRAFARAAPRYAGAASLQAEVAARLDEHLAFTRIAPRRVLDLGCGTGFFGARLERRYPKARVVYADIAEPMLSSARAQLPRRWLRRARRAFVCADAHGLAFRDGGFDLVGASLVLQWARDPVQVVREMRRVCRTGGLIVLATFGRRTLSELREVLADMGAPERVLPFPDVMELGDLLHAEAVETTVADADLIVRHYADARALFAELKAIGASAAALPARRKGLGGRRWLAELARRYEARFRDEKGVRATFEVLYAQAWAAHRASECAIPIRPAR